MGIISQITGNNKQDTYRVEPLTGEMGVSYILPEALRKEAAKALDALDFPTTRDEAWKYTRVAKIRNTQFEVKDTHSIAAADKYIIPGLEGSVLVFVNGFYKESLSTIRPGAGVSVSPLHAAESWAAPYIGAQLKVEGEIFNAMNTLYATGGAAIRIAKSTQAEGAIQLIFVSTGEKMMASNRNVIVCEDFASAHITLGFFSENAASTFSNTVTEIYAGANSQLTIDKLQTEDTSAFSISTEEVSQEKDAVFTINTITLDGGLVRNNLSIAVNGQNSETNLSGAYILKGKQHVDNHTVVDHKVAHCLSNELYKGVMDEQSTAVFNGKVFVRKDAQKINAFQSNGNVLLSDDATVNSKPELEIYADDVKCSHGSTTGQLDEEAVFYLRARGLSETSARALMVSAFIGDVLEKVESEPVRSFIDRILLEKFGWEF